MCRLKEEEICIVSERLKSDEIAYSHLFDDLLDHICCDIENKMQEGLTFNKAFEIVLDKIGLNGLKEIQEATIFYVKLNLILMKKVMNVMAVAGIFALATSFLFKINHWPGGSFLMFIGFLILFLGFFPVALLNIRKDLSVGLFSKKFVVYLIGFICLLETGAAVLFTTMHWPGGGYLVLISWTLMILVFFPMLFYSIIKSDKNKITNLGLAIFAMMFIGTSIVSSYNRQTSINNTVEYSNVTQELEYYRKAIDQQLNNMPKEQSDSLSLIFAKSNTLLDILEQTILNYQNLILNGKTDIYQIAGLINHKSLINEYDDRFQTLKKAVNNYGQEARNLCSSNTILIELVDAKTNTNKFTGTNKTSINWEDKNLQGNYVMLYTHLQCILKDAYQLKYEIIRNMNYQQAPEL